MPQESILQGTRYEQLMRSQYLRTNIMELGAFVGLINYGKFIPHVVAHMAPLYRLLEKDQKWVLTEECDSAFQTCKDM